MLLNVACPLLRGELRSVEIKQNVELEYVHKVQDACKKGVWGRGCHTYYVNKDGWNHVMYPWSRYSLSSVLGIG